MTEPTLKYDVRGIVRNQNGFPAYCFFAEKYCLKPYCFRCSSYEEPKYTPFPEYDADAALFQDFVEDPELLKLMGSATKKWFRKYKEQTEAKLKITDVRT